MTSSYKTIDQRQSYVQKSGDAWEIYVLKRVNKDLRQLGSSLVVIRGKNVGKGSSIWQKLGIPVGGADSNQKVWGDVDLIVVGKIDNPVAVISCKTSLHGRLSESLFYAVVLKSLVPELKFVLSTPDKGRQGGNKHWESEWGGEDKPTKDRLLGSYYLDGIYIENNKTKLGGKLKPLDRLARDLVDWRSHDGS